MHFIFIFLQVSYLHNQFLNGNFFRHFLHPNSQVVRDYQNFSLSDAHQQTREKGADIFNHVKYSWEESLPVAQEATLSDIHNYGNTLYEKTFVEGLVYGDFKESDARRANVPLPRRPNPCMWG